MKGKKGGQKNGGHYTHSLIFPEDEAKSTETGGAKRGRRRNGGTNERGTRSLFLSGGHELLLAK